MKELILLLLAALAWGAATNAVYAQAGPFIAPTPGVAADVPDTSPLWTPQPLTGATSAPGTLWVQATTIEAQVAPLQVTPLQWSEGEWQRGALIGASVGAIVGLAVGYVFNDGTRRVTGQFSPWIIVGPIGGAVVGAGIGSGIGWIIGQN